MRRFKEAWTGKVAFRPTERHGHGIDLAREAALEGFATVAAAGGDGTAHEVATGLLNSRRTDVTFAVIPLGSANDYAHSVRHQFGAMTLRGPLGNLLDVGLARTPDGREFPFFESLGTGLSAQVTLESNAIRWLQGRLLYGCESRCASLSRTAPLPVGRRERLARSPSPPKWVDELTQPARRDVIIAGEAVVRRPAIRQKISAEKRIPDRTVHREALVDRIAFGTVVPMVDTRRGNQPADRPEFPANVRVNERRLHDHHHEPRLSP